VRDRRARSGFTLIELVVSFALLGLLTVLALGVITSIQQPTTEVILRADMTTKGIGSAALMLREIEGGIFSGAATTVGPYVSGDIPVPDAGVIFSVSDPGDGSEEVVNTTGDPKVSFGDAIKFQPVTEVAGSTYDVAGEAANVGGAVVYAFVLQDPGDGDRDGLINEWTLVRVSNAGATVTTIMTDIANQDQFGPTTAYEVAHPALQDVYYPHFTLEHPATLRVRFTAAAQTGYDTSSQTREFSLVTFDRSVFLRNQAP
jgi:prepilin-type N-terminal cleavage/methylation domain-containing protein